MKTKIAELMGLSLSSFSKVVLKAAQSYDDDAVCSECGYVIIQKDDDTYVCGCD